MKTKNTSLFTVLLSASLLLFISACSTATDDGYGRWDEDSNATLDEREFGTAWGEEGYYGRWDANNDSYLDENEWNTNRTKYLGDYDGSYQDWDSDGDNRLSEDEFRLGTYSYFDRDGDNMMNEEEFNLWRTPGTEQD